MTEAAIGGIGAIAAILIVSAVFGRVHQGSKTAIGDRVASGLLATPLIVLLIHLALPEVNIILKLIAPIPRFLHYHACRN